MSKNTGIVLIYHRHKRLDFINILTIDISLLWLLEAAQ
jgi:hypothetical protein